MKRLLLLSAAFAFGVPVAAQAQSNEAIITYVGSGKTPGSVCGDSGHALAWNGTDYFCQAITGGSAGAGGSNTQIQYNQAGAIAGMTGATTDGTSLIISSGNLKLSGSGSGTSIVNAPATGGGTLTLPPGSDTIAALAAVQTFTNKTLTAPVLTAPVLGTPASGDGSNLTNLPATSLTGTIAAARMPAFTGDVTTSIGAVANVLATVNSNVGTFGDATHCASVTVNGKGLVTAASQSTSCPGAGSSITWPTSGYVVISNATNSPTGIAPTNGNCLVGAGGAWTSGSCGGASSVSVTSASSNIVINPSPGTATFTVGATYPIRAVTATSDTILAADGGGLVTYSNASAVAVNLPNATGSFATGYSFTVQNKGAGLVTITPTTAQINGGATLTVATNRGCTIVSDGTNYQVSDCTALDPSGTVTSITAGSGLSGGTITGTGTIALATIAADNLLANSTGSTAVPIATAIGSCSGGSSALTYNTSTHAFGCNTISGSGTVNSGTSGQVGYYASSSTAISGNSNMNITSGLLSLGTNTTTIGQIKMFGNTSGDVTITPNAVAGTSKVATLPANTGIIAELNLAQNWTAQQSNCITPLSASSNTYTPDGTCNNYSLTLAATNTIANPSATPVAGTAGVIEVDQDATGSRTVTWGSQYIAATSVASAIVLSTAASAKDFISYYVLDSTHILISVGALNAAH